MKTKVLEFLRKYRYWLGLLLAIIIIGVTLYMVLPGENVTEQVTSQQANANDAKQTAANANANAANNSIERRTEDAYREKVILPKTESARANSNRSKTEVQNVRRKYENEKSNTENLNGSHSDNCARLVRLFPDVRFEDCQ